MKRLTEFQGLKIYSENGESLGRLFDLRSPGLPEHGETHADRRIEELVYGKVGLFQRLGLIQSKADTISWERVVEIKNGKIVIR